MRLEAAWKSCAARGVSILRRASASRNGPACPEAGLFVLRQADPFRGGMEELCRPRRVYPEACLLVPRRACSSRGGVGI